MAYLARARPTRLACLDLTSGARLTYAALETRSARMSAVLERVAGNENLRGARVAVLARNSSELVCLHLACLRSGAVFVPLNWRLSATELSGLVRIAAPLVLIVDPEFAPVSARLRDVAPEAHVLELGEDGSFEWHMGHAQHEPRASYRPLGRDVVTLLFTSGTTGRPKGVMVTAGNTRASARNFALSVDIDASTVFLCDMPMFHVVGLFTVTNTVLQSGGTLLISSQFSAPDTQARIADPALGVTHYFCVPQMAQMLRRHPAFDPAPFRRLKALQTGGAPHSAEAVGAWHAQGVRCADGFGMTEAGTVLGMPPADFELLRRKAGSVGLPAVSMDVRLVDREGRDVGSDEVGEIWLRGPSVTPGYWRDPEATRAAFDDGWLRSGDAARRDADGFYTMVDRWKDMYISGGENVYPAEIEGVLLELPAVEEVAVVGIDDERWGEVGAAYVVLAPQAQFTLDAMLAHCRHKLAGYKIPKQLHIVDELPRTASGKVKKDLLRARRDA